MAMPEAAIVECLDGHEAPAICAACGGRCCNELPGIYLPSDLLAPGVESLDALTQTFRSGKYAIDWWDGDPNFERHEVSRGYFIRPAIRGTTRLYDPSWGGTCVRLTSKGCELPLADRPAGCRLLKPIPQPRESCKADERAGKQKAALAWEPYWPIIHEAARLSGRTERD